MRRIRVIVIFLLLVFCGIYLCNVDLNDGDYINKLLTSLKDVSLFNVNKFNSLEDSGVDFEDYDFDSTYYPHYGLLSEKEQTVYKQIYANAYEGKSTFRLAEKIKVSEIPKIILFVYNDHPELFWVNNNYSYRYTDDGYCVQLTLEFNEFVNNLDYYKTVFERNAKVIINKAKTFETDYEKEKYVFDTIIEMSDYDENSDINQSAYSAIVLNKTVCAGYAKAFQYIMLELGIPTYYVSGDAQGDHAWNIVKLDGEYYNVDLTWGDQEVIIYNFFNVSDEILNKTHTRSEISKLLPVCNGKEYSNLEKTYDIVIGGEEVVDESISNDNEVYNEDLLGVLRDLVDNGENIQN